LVELLPLPGTDGTTNRSDHRSCDVQVNPSLFKFRRMKRMCAAYGIFPGMRRTLLVQLFAGVFLLAKPGPSRTTGAPTAIGQLPPKTVFDLKPGIGRSSKTSALTLCISNNSALNARHSETSPITFTRLRNLTWSCAAFFCIQARQMRSSSCGLLSMFDILFRT